ncbi:hypothetical protein WS71_19085 [Burkholderia mayonis]|uniref:Uncharacterized protein n=1 Tax=Burkholderia mayonis TaxID=1385591 RepID=A0A1B4G0L9_9BURK|nr:hypothetical protein WS71_19085 [Burkholderia mayonis]KVE47225.1 hypothetical protein WS71_19805 [Burkholderia mayonis]
MRCGAMRAVHAAPASIDKRKRGASSAPFAWDGDAFADAGTMRRSAHAPRHRARRRRASTRATIAVRKLNRSAR